MKLNIVREFEILELPKTKREFWSTLKIGDKVQIKYHSYVEVKLENNSKVVDFYNIETFNRVIETLEKNGLVYKEILEEEKK